MVALLRSPVVIFAAVVTALFAAIDGLHFTYFAPELRIVLETVTSLGALIAAVVVLGRFRRSRTQSQLALMIALALLGAASVTVAAFVAIQSAPRAVIVVAIAARLVGAWALVAAAFLPSTPVARPVRTAVLGTVGVGVLVALVSWAFLASVADIGNAELQRLAAAGEADQSFVHDLAGFHALTLVGFILAAFGFSRMFARTGDAFFYWIAIAAVLAATARAHYLLAAPAGKFWIHTGDVFVLLSYCALLFGAVHEILTYWRRAAETAVLEERRRIARELHDSVAQELAFIARRSRRPGSGPHRPDADLGRRRARTQRLAPRDRRADAAARRAARRGARAGDRGRGRAHGGVALPRPRAGNRRRRVEDARGARPHRVRGGRERGPTLRRGDRAGRARETATGSASAWSTTASASIRRCRPRRGASASRACASAQRRSGQSSRSAPSRARERPSR